MKTLAVGEGIPWAGTVIPVQPNVSGSSGVPLQEGLRNLSPPYRAVHKVVGNFCFDGIPGSGRTGHDWLSDWVKLYHAFYADLLWYSYCFLPILQQCLGFQAEV